MKCTYLKNSLIRIGSLWVCLGLLGLLNVNAQNVTITNIGTTTWTVPNGVSVIKIEAVGGGGAGGYSSDNGRGCGGGGGAAFAATNFIYVTPGEKLTVTVGQGGLNKRDGTFREATASMVTRSNNELLVKAAEGQTVPRNSYQGAAGGKANDCFGDTKWTGGTGGSSNSSRGANTRGSSGGGAAGRTGNGSNGVDGENCYLSVCTYSGGAGKAPGGNGGCGAGVSGYPLEPCDGSNYGGGGGGMKQSNNSNEDTPYDGGAGAQGVVLITYVCDQYKLSSTTSSVTSVCEGAQSAVTDITLRGTTLNSSGGTGTIAAGNYTVTYKVNNGSELTKTISFNASGVAVISSVALPSPINGNVTVTVTRLVNASGGCGSVISENNTATITQNPLPVLSFTNVTNNAADICSGNTATNPGLSSTVANTTYNVTATANGVSGYTTSGTNIGASYFTSQTLVYNSAPGTVTYTVTPVSPSGCTGSSKTYTVTVKPLSVASISSANSYIELCTGETVSIPVNITGGTAPYTIYYKENLNGVITQKNIQTSSSSVNLTYNNCTQNFSIELTSILNGNGCNNTLAGSNTSIIEVYSPGLVTLTDEICDGTKNYTFLLDPPAGLDDNYSFSWTITDVYNVTNVIPNTTGISKEIQLQGPLSTGGELDNGGTITIGVTSTFFTNTKSCSKTEDVVITVGNGLTVQVVDKVFCSGENLTTIDLNSLIVTYPGYICEFYEDNEGLNKIDNPSNYPIPGQTENVYVKAVSTDVAGCESPYIPVPVQIETTPTVIVQNCDALQHMQQGYDGTMILKINDTENIWDTPTTAALSKWTSSNPAAVTITHEGAGDFVAQCNAGSAVLTYSYTDKNGCAIQPISCTVTVDPLVTPAITMLPENGVVCAHGPVTLTATDYTDVSVQTKTYTWYKNGSVVSGTTKSITVTEAGNYTVKATVNDCESETSSAAGVILSILDVEIVKDGSAIPALYKGTLAGLGISVNVTTNDDGSGSGVWTSSNIDIPVTGTGEITDVPCSGGTTTLTYTYTDGNNCTSSKTYQLTIPGLPTLAVSADRSSFCPPHNAGFQVEAISGTYDDGDQEYAYTWNYSTTGYTTGSAVQNGSLWTIGFDENTTGSSVLISVSLQYSKNGCSNTTGTINVSLGSPVARPIESTDICLDLPVTYSVGGDGYPRENAVWNFKNGTGENAVEGTDYRIDQGGDGYNNVTLTWLTAGGKIVSVSGTGNIGVCPVVSTLNIIVPSLNTEWEGLASSDWSDPDNWSDGVPGKCTAVIIPGEKTNYPVLDDAGTFQCTDIHFEFGAEVARTNYLTYERAFVDLILHSNQWYMVAPALYNQYSGDYFAEGSRFRKNPGVYMMNYQMANPQYSDIQKAALTWSSPFSTLDQPLNLCSGQAVWVDNQTLPNGNFTFRFPKDSTEYAYYSALNIVSGMTNEIPRDAQYRFIYEGNASYQTNGDGSFTQGFDNTSGYDQLIVGNPYMSHLDIVEFQKVNKDYFNPSFRIWKSGSPTTPYVYESYLIVNGEVVLKTDPGTDTGFRLSPMQSVIMDVNEDLVGMAKTATYPIQFTPDMSITTPGQTLRSQQNTSDVVHLEILRSGIRQSGMALRYMEGAGRSYEKGKDVWTIFPGSVTDYVLLYALEGGAMSIHTTGDIENPIPLGISVGNSIKKSILNGNTESYTIQIAGNYTKLNGREVWLYDAKEDVSHNLSESAYPFNNVAEDLSADGSFTGRFRLYTMKDLSAMEDPSAGMPVSVSYVNKKVTVRSNDDNNPVRSVEIFNVMGQELHKATRINASEWSYSLPVNEPVIVVKVQTDKKVISVKLMGELAENSN